MANSNGGRTLDYHRRLALESMPPSELRDDYLLYLDDLERRERRDQAEARAPEGSAAPRPQAPGDRGGWTVQRTLLAAAGSVAFAYGTWLVTSLW